MKKIFKQLTITCVLVFAGAAVANAQVSVDRVIVNFKASERPVRNLVVHNGGAEPVWIEVISERMERSGFADERRVPTEDLVVSPKRFSIEPNGDRTVRLLLKKSIGAEEQVYRVKFMPQAKEFDLGANQKDGKSSQLKVIFSVGILVFGEPIKPEPKLNLQRDGSKITFKNDGNMNVLFDEVQNCTTENKDCQKLPGVRLYPGNSWETKLAVDRILTIRKQVGDSFEDLVVPGKQS
jgi:Mat/Ecp fimbriae periplasmic chaperone